MKLADLDKVSNIATDLSEAMVTLNKIDGLLYPKVEDYYGAKTRLSIGGDIYGNGKFMDIAIDVRNCKTSIKHLLVARAKVWSKIVTMRADLRILGVNVDEN